MYAAVEQEFTQGVKLYVVVVSGVIAFERWFVARPLERGPFGAGPFTPGDLSSSDEDTLPAGVVSHCPDGLFLSRNGGRFFAGVTDRTTFVDEAVTIVIFAVVALLPGGLTLTLALLTGGDALAYLSTRPTIPRVCCKRRTETIA